MSIDPMDRVTAVQTKYIDELMQKKHVVGVAVGLAQVAGSYTDEIALVVMVDKKIPRDELAPEDRIPHELDGVRVDIQETGAFSAF